MNRIHRKIVSGAILGGISLLMLYGSSRLIAKTPDAALPVSLTDIDTAPPVIILDAGHGESTKTELLLSR
ncbi:hypothetical protein [Ruminococcus sp. XPD3002]|uniref:hypothetical protein n=1 Tax=Ruminococcus sp. XPD3002 TaxID=1452269 RepID=UPI0009217224|nr:hypothetical protein SAMN04487832_101245 [Ruminococcus flavefaciens]